MNQTFQCSICLREFRNLKQHQTRTQGKCLTQNKFNTADYKRIYKMARKHNMTVAQIRELLDRHEAPTLDLVRQQAAEFCYTPAFYECKNACGFVSNNIQTIWEH